MKKGGTCSRRKRDTESHFTFCSNQPVNTWADNLYQKEKEREREREREKKKKNASFRFKETNLLAFNFFYFV